MIWLLLGLLFGDRTVFGLIVPFGVTALGLTVPPGMTVFGLPVPLGALAPVPGMAQLMAQVQPAQPPTQPPEPPLGPYKAVPITLPPGVNEQYVFISTPVMPFHVMYSCTSKTSLSSTQTNCSVGLLVKV